MSYDIYIADKNKKKVLQLPIIPTELPEKSVNISNEEFKTYDNGTFNFIKYKGLDTLNLTSWLPVKNYYFAKSNTKANEVISLIEYAVEHKEYIQVVIIKSDGTTYVNDKFSVEGFKYNVRKNENYNYTLDLKQYREPPKQACVLGWNLDSTGWWYCTNVENYEYYKNGWQLIDTQWYWFNANGYALAHQWLLYKNKWYWLKDNCQMFYNGWLKINGLWYYFYKDGSMAANTTTPDGYKVNSSGAWVQ